MLGNKPCPFCGGSDLMVMHGNTGTPHEYEATIWCSDCNTDGPVAAFYPTPEEAEEKAWELWNKRA